MVYVYGVELRGEERDRFVREFNHANYLYQYGVVPELSKHPIVVNIKQGRKKYEFKMYLYGDQMIEMIRVKKRKTIPYRVRSKELAELLEARTKYEWWMN